MLHTLVHINVKLLHTSVKFVGFLQFLARSRPCLRHLDMTSSQLLTLYGKVKNVAKSLVADVLKENVGRHAKGEDKLDILPGQVAESLEGARDGRAR